MPRYKIVMDGVIGWDVYGSKIRKQLVEAESQEVEIEIHSPGGFVYDGLEIFNIIREYNKNVAKVYFKMMGLAASMASHIMMSVPVSQRSAYSNTVFMIHNTWTFAAGDHNELRKAASEIESLTKASARDYAIGSGKNVSEIIKLMNDETYYYGSEILEAGFVSEILETDSEENNKSELVSFAKGRIKNNIEKMQQSEKSKRDLHKAAALLTEIETPEINNIIVSEDEIVKIEESKQEIKMEVKIMPKLKELLSQNPEANAEYNENIQAAKDIGEKNVQDRIDAVIPFLNNENYKGMENLTAEVLSGKTEISALKSAIAVIDNMRETEKSKAAKDDTIDNPDIPALKNDLPKESGEIESEIDFRAEIARKKGVKV